MRALGVVACVLFAGCDQLLDLRHLGPPDAPHDGLPADAFMVEHCANATFGMPIQIAELTGIATNDPTLRGDRLEMFWAQGMPRDIRHATRASTSDPFVVDPAPLPFDDAVANDEDPTIDLGGNLVVFVSDRGGGTFHAYFATRDMAGVWSTAQLVPNLAAIAIDYVDLSYDGLVLYYADYGATLHEVSRPARDQPFACEFPIGSNIASHSVSADSLELFYRGGPGPFDIYRATRATPTDVFPAGNLVIANHFDGDLTPDGRTLIVEGPVLYERNCP